MNMKKQKVDEIFTGLYNEKFDTSIKELNEYTKKDLDVIYAMSALVRNCEIEAEAVEEAILKAFYLLEKSLQGPVLQ